MFEQFLKNCAAVSVPVGVRDLDENTIQFKERISARSYMKYKLVKFGIRYFIVVGWDIPYLKYIWDNHSGNKCGIPQPVSY